MALNSLLQNSSTIAKTTEELKQKTDKFLISFEENLEPLYKKSQGLKEMSDKVEEALKGANYIFDYLQKAKNLESILGQKYIV